MVSSYEMMKCQFDCEMMKSLSTKKIEKIGQNSGIAHFGEGPDFKEKHLESRVFPYNRS